MLYIGSKKVCSIKDCFLLQKCKNLCKKHYERYQTRKGDPSQNLNELKMVWKKCSIEKCENQSKTLNMCHKHYMRFYRYGDSDTVSDKRKGNFNRNDNFLNTFTPESCYFLGLLVSDGYVDEKNNSLSFHQKDLQLCQIIERLFNLENSIKQDKNRNAYRINIISKTVIGKAIELGIRQRKSLNVPYPPIPEEFKYHFLRGCWDGDGCQNIRYDKKYGYVRLCSSLVSGSKQFIESVDKAIDIKHCFRVNKSKNPLYVISINDSFAGDFCKLLYKDSEGLRLDRKYDKYKRYMLEKYNEIV